MRFFLAATPSVILLLLFSSGGTSGKGANDTFGVIFGLLGAGSEVYEDEGLYSVLLEEADEDVRGRLYLDVEADSFGFKRIE
jgi:hypothetical protein